MSCRLIQEFKQEVVKDMEIDRFVFFSSKKLHWIAFIFLVKKLLAPTYKKKKLPLQKLSRVVNDNAVKLFSVRTCERNTCSFETTYLAVPSAHITLAGA